MKGYVFLCDDSNYFSDKFDHSNDPSIESTPYSYRKSIYETVAEFAEKGNVVFCDATWSWSCVSYFEDIDYLNSDIGVAILTDNPNGVQGNLKNAMLPKYIIKVSDGKISNLGKIAKDIETHKRKRLQNCEIA